MVELNALRTLSGTVSLDTHRCPDIAAQVDLETCEYDASAGAQTLAARWKDPNFNASQRAFYYAGVLENLSCCWSIWEVIRNGVEPNPNLPAIIQQWAWSSPI